MPLARSLAGLRALAGRMTVGGDPSPAQLLLTARRTRRQIDGPLPPIASEAEAYAIQDTVARETGPIGGWKVGAKDAAAVPTCAPIPAAVLHPSPAELPAQEFHMIGIEAELAFRFGRAFAPGARAVTPDEVLDGVASVHAALEIVDTRLGEWRRRDRLWLLADSQMNAGLVYGASATSWRGLALDQAPVRLTVNDTLRVERRGGNPGGHPVRLLVWLVNHVCRERGGLAQGSLVTTGSCTGMIFVEPGARVEADFVDIGAATVLFR
jgi:2-keto-4-pentenoate hydratase